MIVKVMLNLPPVKKKNLGTLFVLGSNWFPCILPKIDIMKNTKNLEKHWKKTEILEAFQRVNILHIFLWWEKLH